MKLQISRIPLTTRVGVQACASFSASSSKCDVSFQLTMLKVVGTHDKRLMTALPKFPVSYTHLTLPTSDLV